MNEDIKILEEIIKGNEDCIESISKFNSNNKQYDEDIEHYKREIRGITNIINSYKKEKARADKLEKEYSKMLTKIDEYEVNYIPISLVEEKIEELKQEGNYKTIENLINRNKELEENIKKQKQLTKLAQTITDESLKEALIEFEKDYIPKSKIKEKRDYYKKEIDKMENKKIWNEPIDTIRKNRFINYFNILQELLGEEK